MKTKVNFIYFVSSLIVILFSGCSRGPETVELVNIPDGFLRLSSEVLNDLSKDEKKIFEMAPSNVIVDVNGASLTKRDFDIILDLKAKSLMQEKGMTEYVMDKKLDAYRRTYINKYIAQRLLVDAAFTKGVVTTNEVKECVAERIAKIAAINKCNTQEYLNKLGDESRIMMYELGVSYIMDKYISKCIPPKADVTDEFIAELKKQVKSLNEAANATNNLMKIRLQTWRKQIIEKNEDFQKIAKTVSDIDEDFPSQDDGIWGEFELGDLDPQEFNLAVFSLPLDGISEVLEDDNGFHLIKVVSITPAVKGSRGDIVEPEKRKLSHIYLEKAPLLMEESDIVMTREMKYQMQIQAVNEAVSELSTNGVNRITYPHGASLF